MTDQDRFRWVSCQLDSLRKCIRASAVTATLRSLPNTLDETYERILLNISEETYEEAISALNWLVFSKRTLSVGELAELCAINTNDHKPFSFGDRLFETASTLNILSGLITVIPWSDWFPLNDDFGRKGVRLAHFSVEEYLVSSRVASGPASRFQLSNLPSTSKILVASLNYLLSNDVVDAHKTGQLPPLLDYVCYYLAPHLQDCRSALSKTVKDLLRKLFECGESYKVWQERAFGFTCKPYADRVERLCYSRWNKNRLDSSIPPLYYACRLNLPEVAAMLSDDLSGEDIEREAKTSVLESLSVPGKYADELRAA